MSSLSPGNGNYTDGDECDDDNKHDDYGDDVNDSNVLNSIALQKEECDGKFMRE